MRPEPCCSNWEFETYAATTGAVNIWVNAPNLNTGSCDLCLVRAAFPEPPSRPHRRQPVTTLMAVYHLKENPAGAAPQLNDSTANGNNATMNGTLLASQQQPGEIDGSVNFEGEIRGRVSPIRRTSVLSGPIRSRSRAGSKSRRIPRERCYRSSQVTLRAGRFSSSRVLPPRASRSVCSAAGEALVRSPRRWLRPSEPGTMWWRRIRGRARWRG